MQSLAVIKECGCVCLEGGVLNILMGFWEEISFLNVCLFVCFVFPKTLYKTERDKQWQVLQSQESLQIRAIKKKSTTAYIYFPALLHADSPGYCFQASV